jgi:hypothetical protein
MRLPVAAVYFGSAPRLPVSLSPAAADRAVGGGRRGDGGDRPNGWLHDGHCLEVAGALCRGAVDGSGACPAGRLGALDEDGAPALNHDSRFTHSGY